MNKAITIIMLASLVACTTLAQSEEVESPVFSRHNLVAWCIVPFDANNRSPNERAKMLTELGITKVAYDWRKKHVDSFEEEIVQYKKHNLKFFAFWSWHDSLEPLINKHKVSPQIWLTCPSPTTGDKVAVAAKELAPMVARTKRLGLKLGLYNHGGWGGEPKNLTAVCELLREQHETDHVGIVYNFHHGHEHIKDFKKSLANMQPYLLCLNINGMVDASEVTKNNAKILSIGSGRHEGDMISIIRESGYTGPVGILDHRNEIDAAKSLSQNISGLKEILKKQGDKAALATYSE